MTATPRTPEERAAFVAGVGRSSSAAYDDPERAAEPLNKDTIVKALETERLRLTNHIKDNQSKRADLNRRIASDKVELVIVERLLKAAAPRVRRTAS
jgi:hypothetical protein